ncbi:MAG: hypothetical protein EOM05_03680 [Clostridia bacterium]|nr:hypothetical protein [Clostridia bacterium]
MKYYFVYFSIFLTLLCFQHHVFAQENSISDFIQAGKYQKAIDVILMMGSVDELKNADLENLGYCYIMTKEYDKAEVVYAKLTSTKKPSADNIRYYAEILLINQKYNLAKQNFEKCIELTPSDKRLQLKIVSCDSLMLWKNNNSRYTISNFAAINTEMDEMCAIFNGKELQYLSNQSPNTETQDIININILAPYTIKDYDFFKYNVSTTDISEQHKIILSKPLISAKYWFSSLNYCKKNDTYAYTLKRIHKNLQDFTLGNSEIYFGDKNSNAFDNLIAFKWDDMPQNINISQPSFAKNGHRLYFSSDMPGGFGGMDLYYCDLINNVWTKPINLGQNINTEYDELCPTTRGDSVLYYSSNGFPGYGNFDIFCSKFKDNSYGNPVNMKAPINSIGDDLYFNPDYGENSLLTSNRSSMSKGGYDIFVANLPVIIPEKPDTIIPPDPPKLDIANYKLPFILFDINKAEIDKNYEQSLKSLADTLLLYENVKLEILGYTDIAGNSKLNKELSQERAKAIADKLISLGVPKSQIYYQGLGVKKENTLKDISYTIIVGTIKSNNDKEWFNKKLDHKYDVKVMPNGKYYSYCIGDFNNEKQAKELLAEIKSKYFSHAYLGYSYFNKCLPNYSSAINRRADLILSEPGK